jgi:hypothetical protein
MTEQSDFKSDGNNLGRQRSKEEYFMTGAIEATGQSGKQQVWMADQSGEQLEDEWETIVE